MESRLGRGGCDLRAGQVHPDSAGRARVLRVLGIRTLADLSPSVSLVTR